jgi:hypothetical protein
MVLVGFQFFSNTDAKCALNHQSNATLMFLTEGIKIIMETFLQCNCEANLQCNENLRYIAEVMHHILVTK